MVTIKLSICADDQKLYLSHAKLLSESCTLVPYYKQVLYLCCNRNNIDACSNHPSVAFLRNLQDCGLDMGLFYVLETLLHSVNITMKIDNTHI